MSPAELLDVGRDEHGFNLREPDALVVAPCEEPRDRPGVCLPRVRVPNVRGEELDEPFPGPLAGLGDEGREDQASPLPRYPLSCRRGLREDDDFPVQAPRLRSSLVLRLKA